MKISELTLKTPQEIRSVLSTLRRRLLKLRFLKLGTEFKQTHEIKQTRRSIAQVLTVLRQKQDKNHE